MPPGVGGWFDEFTGIYEAMGDRGIDARRADHMELWEVASIMGCHRPDDARPGEAAKAPERDLIAERLAYARGDGPRPEPDRPARPSPDVTNLIRRIP